jgi:hypothetical protein
LNRRPAALSTTTSAWVVFRTVYRLNRTENRFGLEDHSLTSTERPVINRPVPIRSEISQVMDSGFDKTLFPTSPNQAEIERTAEKFRENCDYVERNHIVRQARPQLEERRKNSLIFGYFFLRP